jgi:hypothetical protein
MTGGLPQSKRLVIQSATADLYCELDYEWSKRHCTTSESEPEALLLQAKGMLTLEIQRLPLCGRNSKGYRRILLSLIEIEIRLGYPNQARYYVDEVLSMFGSLVVTDIVDKLGHVRALIASARIALRLEDAEKCWDCALRQNKLYNPSEEDVFTCGVIQLFICLVRYKLGNIPGSLESLVSAKQILNRQQCQFLIPGVRTYLFNSVILETQTVTGWKVLDTN